MLTIGFMIGLALSLLLVVALRCTLTVEEGHCAVLVSFGRALRTTSRSSSNDQQLLTCGPGLHFKMPWHSVIVTSLKEQVLDLSCDDGSTTAMTYDGTILRLDSFVRYVVLREAIYEHLFGLERPREHITGLFTCLLRNEVANFRGDESNDNNNNNNNNSNSNSNSNSGAANDNINGYDFARQLGSYALIRRERKLLNTHIETFCRERIDGRYGVRFNAVDLADVLPPDELGAALNAVMGAMSHAQTRLFRAEGVCQQRILAAERGVSIAQARASAIETEIRRLTVYLAELEVKGVLDAYVARRRSEILVGEASMLFLKEAHVTAQTEAQARPWRTPSHGITPRPTPLHSATLDPEHDLERAIPKESA